MIWQPVTFPDVYCYLIETPGDITGKNAKSIQLCDFRVGQATTGTEAQFWLRQPWRNLPLFFPPSSLDFCPSLFLTRVWGYHDGKNCGIKDVCRYVLEHFGGLMRLIIFPWNKKVNSPPNFLIFLSPEDFRDAFCVAGDAFWRPWLRWIRRLTRRTQDFTMEGFPVGFRGKAPVGILDEVPQKLKQNVKLVYNF